MRTCSLLSVGFIWLIASSGACAYAGNAGRAQRAAVVTAAVSQLGVREHGFNAGPDVEKYQRVSGNHRGDAWCSSFVSWCLKTAGIGTARFGAARSWFDRRHVIWAHGMGRTPQPGDLTGYRWGSREIHHVGIVEHWSPGVSCVTIEGNTHGFGRHREGDGVFRNWRDKRQVSAVADVVDNPRYHHGE